MKKHVVLPLVLAVVFLCAPFTAYALEADERAVVTTGVGQNEEEAKRQAYRNAIQSVVGAMVQAETMVQNDELISDKILSHSDGFITKTQQVGETVTMPGGLVQVTMQVTVKSTQLKEKLKAENITLAEMDGESLFTMLSTQKDKEKDAVSILMEEFKGFPSNVLEAKADTSNMQQKEASGMFDLVIPLVVSVNQEAYSAFVSGLVKKLQDLGYKKETFPLELSENISYCYIGSRNKLQPTSEAQKEKTVFSLAVAEVFNLKGHSSRFTTFLLPYSVFNELEKFGKNLYVLIELVGQDNTAPLSMEVPVAIPYDLNTSLVLDDKYNATILLLPLAGLKSQTYEFAKSYLNGVTLEAHFALTEQELRQIKSIRCTVVTQQ